MKAIEQNDKQCNCCKIVKNTKDFYKQQQHSLVTEKVWLHYDSFCKECRLKNTSIRNRRVKIECIIYKGGKCADCRIEDKLHPEIYDFHHLNPLEKDFTIASKNGNSFEKLKEEVDKCELLCANCHRIRHASM